MRENRTGGIIMIKVVGIIDGDGVSVETTGFEGPDGPAGIQGEQC